MNSVKKVLSRKSHSEDSSDDGRHSTSTAPTSNPGSPVSTSEGVHLGRCRGTGAGANTTTSTTHQSTGEKIANKVDHGLGRSADVHATDGSIRHKQGHDVNANKHLDLKHGEG